VQVLVAYGSKRGGTAGLAEMIGDSLAGAGMQAEVHPARKVKGLEGFDAVVIAGALYANRWHRDARWFARRHVEALRRCPVWLVASGPLDASASSGEIPPVKQVAEAMSDLGARGQRTFGGRLEPTATGFPARAMAKNHSGDWRDAQQVHDWAVSVAADLAAGREPS
jgi:menaquinone-dependent protoporphyrinogen oxidase